MTMNTPKANRVHIGFFGRCNSGKSTLINMLADQPVSLVADVAGTTTDPVSKAMEILPLGPVMITDTAGIDDTSQLGQLRIAKTHELIKKINLAVYVLRSDEAFTEDDKKWIEELKLQELPVAVFINEIGAGESLESESIHKGKESTLSRSAELYVSQHPELNTLATVIGSGNFTSSTNRLELLDLLGGLTPLDAEEDQSLLSGLVNPGDTIVLVCPIDSAAPKGRLILPQVQAIREILDYKGLALVTQTEEIPALLLSLKNPPKLVITDSQAFEEVNALVPDTIPLTSFSILMARFKGKLKDLVLGVNAIKNLKPGSKVLISEGCTHRRQCDDIGTVKIPMWLKQNGYTDLDMTWTSGGAFPEHVEDYDFIIHCGACMLTRREVLRRIDVAVVQGVPIVNYGILIAMLHGILERAISPFKDELQ